LNGFGIVEIPAIGLLLRNPAEVEHYEDKTDHEQHHRNGGTVAHLVVIEGFNIHEIREDARLIEGASPGHDRDKVEGPETVYDADHNDNDRHRCKLGQNNMKKALNRRCAVHHGGIDKALIHALKPRKVENHHIADLTPDRNGNDRSHNHIGIAQPSPGPLVQAGSPEENIDKTEGGIVEPGPYQSADNQGKHHGCKKTCLENLFAGDIPVQDHRQG
jgi:hypothetical protein